MTLEEDFFTDAATTTNASNASNASTVNYNSPGESAQYEDWELEALGIHAVTPRSILCYGAPKAGKSTGAIAVASKAGNAIVLVTDPGLMNGYIEFLKAERAKGNKLAVPMPLLPSQDKVDAVVRNLPANTDDAARKAAVSAFRVNYIDTALKRPGIKYIALNRGIDVNPIEELNRSLNQLRQIFNRIKALGLPRHLVVIDEIYQWCLDAEAWLKGTRLDHLPDENAKQAVRVERWGKYGILVDSDGTKPATANVWGLQAVVDSGVRQLTLSLKNDLNTHIILVTQLREYNAKEVKGKPVVKKQGPLVGLQETAPKTASHEVDAIIQFTVEHEFSFDGNGAIKRAILTGGDETSYRGHRLNPTTPAVWSADTIGVPGTPFADYAPDMVGLAKFWGLI